MLNIATGFYSIDYYTFSFECISVGDNMHGYDLRLAYAACNLFYFGGKLTFCNTFSLNQYTFLLLCSDFKIHHHMQFNETQFSYFIFIFDVPMGMITSTSYRK